MSDLDAAIKDLKRNKARDPNGWLNDIFMHEIAGKNLKISMLKMFNRIKTEDFIPDFIRPTQNKFFRLLTMPIHHIRCLSSI